MRSKKEEVCTPREEEFTHEDTGRWSFEQDLGERVWIGREKRRVEGSMKAMTAAGADW